MAPSLPRRARVGPEISSAPRKARAAAPPACRGGGRGRIWPDQRRLEAASRQPPGRDVGLHRELGGDREPEPRLDELLHRPPCCELHRRARGHARAREPRVDLAPHRAAAVEQINGRSASSAARRRRAGATAAREARSPPARRGRTASPQLAVAQGQAHQAHVEVVGDGAARHVRGRARDDDDGRSRESAPGSVRAPAAGRYTLIEGSCRAARARPPRRAAPGRARRRPAAR